MEPDTRPRHAYHFLASGTGSAQLVNACTLDDALDAAQAAGIDTENAVLVCGFEARAARRPAPEPN